MNSLVPQVFDHSLDADSAKDLDNPRSLVNILPSSVANNIMAIPNYLFEMSFDDLEKRANVTETLEMLRTAWWLEYNRAQKTKTRMNLANVYSGLYNKQGFIRDLCGNSFKLLYMITPPVDYAVQQHHILNMALKQEREILSQPIMKPVFNKQGEQIGEEVDTKLLAIQQKISEAVRNRLMGMPINRTMQINQNFNSNSPMNGNAESKDISQMDEEQLQKYIEENDRDAGLLDESKNVEIKDVMGVTHSKK